ncbi:MAG: NGG1p interacting factor NIF3 [Candidatus Omnitrophota bacterium]
MKLEEFYNLVVKKGLEKDPRTKKELTKAIKNVRKETGLKHPFADTRILYGDKKRDIRTIMIGVDIGGQELLTAYLLNEKGANIDLVMSHHPSGRALAGLHHVMHVQTDLLRNLGLDSKVAESLMKERIEEVARRVMPGNNERTVDIARLLNIPLMCMHTPADNHVAGFLQKTFDKKKPKKAQDVLKLLKIIPEYKDGALKGAGPKLVAGKPGDKAGKIFVDMTGGTEGSNKIFARLSQAGVKTVVGMHFSEEHLKQAKAEFMNVVIAGHIASDNLGINLLLDDVEKNNNLNIIPCSGFVRIKR